MPDAIGCSTPTSLTSTRGGSAGGHTGTASPRRPPSRSTSGSSREFADGTEYTIGEVTEYDPPELLQYTWKAPDWPAVTTITVRFTEEGGRTTVAVTHEGFGIDGVPDFGDSYAEGLREILGGLKAWTQDQGQ